MFTRSNNFGDQEGSPKYGMVRDKTKSRILNKSLAVSLEMADGTVSENAINKILAIICGDAFDAALFRLQVGYLSACKEITEGVIKTRLKGQ